MCVCVCVGVCVCWLWGVVYEKFSRQWYLGLCTPNSDLVAYLLYCTVETNTAFKAIIPQLKKKKNIVVHEGSQEPKKKKKKDAIMLTSQLEITRGYISVYRDHLKQN